MAFGRKKPQPSGSSSGSKPSGRTTSYPQGQDGKAKVVGELRTTSYKSSTQTRTHDLDSIN